MTALPFKKEKILLTLFTLTTVFACSPEPVEIPATNSSLVPIQATEQFSAFDTAAKARGLNISIAPSDYSIFVDTASDEDIVGLCSHNPDKPNQIVIGQKMWEQADDLEKEFIFFHQLGHCQLELQHNDEKNADGVCVSIMRSRASGCTDNYNEDTREAFLDELFSN